MLVRQCGPASRPTWPIPQDPPLKTVAQYTVIGTHQPRVDIPSKVDGSARFGIDVSLPDMLYAAVKTLADVRRQTQILRRQRLPEACRRSRPPSRSRMGSSFVATSYWQARKAARTGSRGLRFPALLRGLDSEKVSQQLRAGFDEAGVSWLAMTADVEAAPGGCRKARGGDL